MTSTTRRDIDVRDNSLAGARAWFAEQGLVRPRQGRIIAGVCAGFAQRYGINVLVTRLIAVMGILALTPLLYVALWILMPKADETPTAADTAATADGTVAPDPERAGR
jgi:phage shock protein PspC (stress-responsive transcriptional regulator)